MSKSDSTIKKCARKPGQKSLTSVNVNQDQSNEIEMEDEAKDLFVHMRMTEEEEEIKAFSEGLSTRSEGVRILNPKMIFSDFSDFF